MHNVFGLCLIHQFVKHQVEQSSDFGAGLVGADGHFFFFPRKFMITVRISVPLGV